MIKEFCDVCEKELPTGANRSKFPLEAKVAIKQGGTTLLVRVEVGPLDVNDNPNFFQACVCKACVLELVNKAN